MEGAQKQETVPYSKEVQEGRLLIRIRAIFVNGYLFQRIMEPQSYAEKATQLPDPCSFPSIQLSLPLIKIFFSFKQNLNYYFHYYQIQIQFKITIYFSTFMPPSPALHIHLSAALSFALRPCFPCFADTVTGTSCIQMIICLSESAISFCTCMCRVFPQ